MKWAGIIIRTLVGLAFFVLGLNHFLNFLDMSAQAEAMPEGVKGYMSHVGGGYMTVVKVLETVGGLLLLTGLFVGVGITLLTPVCVNILLFDIYIAKQPVGPGLVLTVLCFVLVGIYWPHFRAVFAMKPMTCCRR